MPNIWKELGAQQQGTLVKLSGPQGQQLSFRLRDSAGYTEWGVAVAAEVTATEQRRFKAAAGSGKRSPAQTMSARDASRVSPAENQAICRALAPDHLFLGFDPSEWDGLEDTVENRRKMIEIDWVWDLIRGWCLLGEQDVLEPEEVDEAEKKSDASSDGTSPTDTESARSSRGSDAPKKTTKRK